MLRRCFLKPLPQHESAAALLSEAADALLNDKPREAANLIRRADLPCLEDYRHSIAGCLNPTIHRIEKMPTYDRVANTTGPRMPTPAVAREIFSRDGHRCRFCNSRVIAKEARQAFVNALPTAVRWGNTNAARHFGLAVLSASIDHVVPFQRGGDSKPKNLVTACSPCQFGRGHCLLHEVELEDPRNYAPKVDDWDGLMRLRGFKFPRDGDSRQNQPAGIGGEAIA